MAIKHHRERITPEKVKMIRRHYELGRNSQETSNLTKIKKPTVGSYYLAWNRGFETPTEYLNELARRRGEGNHKTYQFLRKESELPPLDVSSLPQPIIESPTIPTKESIEREEIRRCLTLLGVLKPSYEELLRKVFYEGRSLREIGNEEGRSYQTIHSRLQNALSLLGVIYTGRNV